ncbi:MAG: transposase [Mesorhizobium sp.]|nr:MAG: transposase [Mesorhizobium sp.]
MAPSVVIRLSCLGLSEITRWVGRTTRRQYCRAGHRNANALTDNQWVDRDVPTAAKATGRPRTTELRAVVDALFYTAWTGCQWRALPAASRRFRPFNAIRGLWKEALNCAGG